VNVQFPSAQPTTLESQRLGKPICYWITTSAVANSVSGMVRPSALAVLRLTTSSNFVGN
jgi:hypothetical protein